MMTWPEGAEYSGEFLKGRIHGCVCICVCVVLCVFVYLIRVYMYDDIARRS